MADEYPTNGWKREDILGLQRGDVIKYKPDNYLVVDEIDTERDVVTGRIVHPAGVNAVPIEDLVEKGIEIATWARVRDS